MTCIAKQLVFSVNDLSELSVAQLLLLTDRFNVLWHYDILSY